MSKEDSNGPRSIGIIMDGNRRWAKENGLPQLEGHRIGIEKIKDAMKWAQERGISEVTIYAFSTENWNRSEEEVSYLMKLFEAMLDNWIQEVIEHGGCLKFIGQLERLPKTMQKKISEVTELTKNGKDGTLIIALSYGGRAEILDAVNKLIVMDREVVTEQELRDAMWSAGLHDPDLIIRTGGEKRLSNFLAWQSTYSELFFTDTKWPAFTKEEFNMILDNYAERERRRGQ